MNESEREVLRDLVDILARFDDFGMIDNAEGAEKRKWRDSAGECGEYVAESARMRGIVEVQS